MGRQKGELPPASPLPAPLVFNTCTEQKYCQFGFFATYVKGQFLDRKADSGLESLQNFDQSGSLIETAKKVFTSCLTKKRPLILRASFEIYTISRNAIENKNFILASDKNFMHMNFIMKYN